MTMRRLSEKAFTLIELMLTMQIIAILALSALPVYADLQWRARISASHYAWSAMNNDYQATTAMHVLRGGSLAGGNNPVTLWNDPNDGQVIPFNKLCQTCPVGKPEGFVAIMNGVPNCNTLKFMFADASVDWVYSYASNRIYASTDDCSKSDPTGW